ncbi:hypothetical protein ZWY2020_010603 [Hordeum vulgare]|nr:hypothetical protein ZWY2020_010603 [Hordeum vulgare]
MLMLALFSVRWNWNWNWKPPPLTSFISSHQALPLRSTSRLPSQLVASSPACSAVTLHSLLSPRRRWLPDLDQPHHRCTSPAASWD